jgi:hypothetical protein
VLHMQNKAFWPHLTKVGKLRAQGRREAAADALLSILTDASRISPPIFIRRSKATLYRFHIRLFLQCMGTMRWI